MEKGGQERRQKGGERKTGEWREERREGEEIVVKKRDHVEGRVTKEIKK